MKIFRPMKIVVAAGLFLVGTSGLVFAGDEVPAAAAETVAAQIRDISAVEANDYLSSDSAARDKVVVLDIRTAKEFGEGHLKGAKNINFLGKEFKDELAKLDKDRTYVMHCQSGGRSSRAKKVFQELGFKKVLHIQDGYRAWASAGFPVEKGTPAE